MPDITKCASDHCPRKEQCWRYVCEPSPFWQSYSSFDPENCERFIDAEKLSDYEYDRLYRQLEVFELTNPDQIHKLSPVGKVKGGIHDGH